MAALMAIGVGAALLAAEPERGRRGHARPKRPLWTPARLFRRGGRARSSPSSATHGPLGRADAATITLYHLSDYLHAGRWPTPIITIWACPRTPVAGVRGSLGLVGSIAGIAAGGVAPLRFGFVPHPDRRRRPAADRRGRLRPA